MLAPLFSLDCPCCWPVCVCAWPTPAVPRASNAPSAELTRRRFIARKLPCCGCPAPWCGCPVPSCGCTASQNLSRTPNAERVLEVRSDGLFQRARQRECTRRHLQWARHARRASHRASHAASVSRDGCEFSRGREKLAEPDAAATGGPIRRTSVPRNRVSNRPSRLVAGRTRSPGPAPPFRIERGIGGWADVQVGASRRWQ